jgi:hypothetical protein
VAFTVGCAVGLAAVLNVAEILLFAWATGNAMGHATHAERVLGGLALCAGLGGGTAFGIIWRRDWQPLQRPREWQ